jgi:hypothetical protein
MSNSSTNSNNIKNTKSHRSDNGWKPCSATQRPCPLGGVHVNTAVVPVLNFIDKPYFEVNPQDTTYMENIKEKVDEEAIVILKEIKEKYEALRESVKQKEDAEINLFKGDFEVGQQLHQQKKDQVKEARKIFDNLKMQLSLKTVGLSDEKIYKKVVAGEILRTNNQIKIDSQLFELQTRNAYIIRRNEAAKKLVNKPFEIELSNGSEFFRASPSLSNTFGNQQMIGSTAIQTYNNAIKKLILDNVKGNGTHFTIVEKLRAVNFIRSQLEATAEAAYDHKTKELKRTFGLLGNRSAKALHKAHGVVLKEFFMDLHDSSWDSRIKSEN